MRFDDFKKARRWKVVNRFLQITLSILLVAGLNFLASKPQFQKRWDLGSETRQSLSFETRQYLKNIAASVLAKGTGEPVYIYTTISEENVSQAERGALKTLLTKVKYLLNDINYEMLQAGGGREGLKIEAADSVKNAGKRQELTASFGPIRPDIGIFVVYGTQFKALTLGELLRVNTNAQGEQEVDAFKGEEAVVGALLEVTNENKPVVYLTDKHEEMSPDDQTLARGLSKFTLNLTARNLEVKRLDLAKFGEVPANTRLVIIASPKKPFTPQEVEKLRRYMRERNGRIIVLADVGNDTGLANLFDDWGILVDDARAIDKSPDARAPNGDMLVRSGNRRHPLTRQFAEQKIPIVLAEARSVRFDPGSPIDDETLKVDELFQTSSNPAMSWGEFNYRQPADRQQYNPASDLPAPVSIAAIAERSSGRDQKISRGKLLIIGSGSIAANAGVAETANALFLFNAVNWMLEREQFLNIPPRPIAEFKLQATQPDLKRVAWRFALLPGGILLLGLLIHLWRRST